MSRWEFFSENSSSKNVYPCTKKKTWCLKCIHFSTLKFFAESDHNEALTRSGEIEVIFLLFFPLLSPCPTLPSFKNSMTGLCGTPHTLKKSTLKWWLTQTLTVSELDSIEYILVYIAAECNGIWSRARKKTSTLLYALTMCKTEVGEIKESQKMIFNLLLARKRRDIFFQQHHTQYRVWNDLKKSFMLSQLV